MVQNSYNVLTKLTRYLKWSLDTFTSCCKQISHVAGAIRVFTPLHSVLTIVRGILLPLVDCHYIHYRCLGSFTKSLVAIPTIHSGPFLSNSCAQIFRDNHRIWVQSFYFRLLEIQLFPWRVQNIFWSLTREWAEHMFDEFNLRGGEVCFVHLETLARKISIVLRQPFVDSFPPRFCCTR